MLKSFVVLGAIAALDGGAGLSKLYATVRYQGFDYSKYRIKNTLEELIKIGAVVKVGHSYSLSLLGANLVAADVASAIGVEVLRDGDYGMTMPKYQKGL